VTEASGAHYDDTGPGGSPRGSPQDSLPATPGAVAATGGDPVLVLREIRKVYGATIAVHELTVSLNAGQVHAVVGENGAGKSTAAQIAAGVIRPTAGHVEFEGQPVAFGSARDAEALGIVFIPQELQLYESLSVAENMYVGRPRPRIRGLVAAHTMRRRARGNWPGSA
jgi:ABC-type sugar transport system ATPase subunit